MKLASGCLPVDLPLDQPELVTVLAVTTIGRAGGNRWRGTGGGGELTAEPGIC